MKYKYFSYCPEDGFDTHETLEDALLNANGIIPNYLDDGWSEDVTGVFVGTITHAATMCDKVERDGSVDEYGCDDTGSYWDPEWAYKCDYKMLPVEIDANQNPAGWVVVGPGGFMSGIETVKQHAVDLKYDMDLELSVNHTGPAHDVLPVYMRPTQPAPDVAKLVEALKRLVFAAQCRDNSIGDQIRLVQTREELSAAAKNAEEALALYRKQGGDL